MEKRNPQLRRIPVVADVTLTDGSGGYLGTTANISKAGMCITGLHSRLLANRITLTTTLGGKNFRLEGRVCHTSRVDNTITVGIEFCYGQKLDKWTSMIDDKVKFRPSANQ